MFQNHFLLSMFQLFAVYCVPLFCGYHWEKSGYTFLFRKQNYTNYMRECELRGLEPVDLRIPYTNSVLHQLVPYYENRDTSSEMGSWFFIGLRRPSSNVAYPDGVTNFTWYNGDPEMGDIFNEYPYVSLGGDNNQYCMAAIHNKTHFWTLAIQRCHKERAVICHNKTGQQCTFDMYEDLQLQPPDLNTTSILGVATTNLCKQFCENPDISCWSFAFSSSSKTCQLVISIIMPDDVEFCNWLIPEPSWNTYRRVCIQLSLIAEDDTPLKLPLCPYQPSNQTEEPTNTEMPTFTTAIVEMTQSTNQGDMSALVETTSSTYSTETNSTETRQSSNSVEITQSTNSVEITQSTNPVEITQSTNPVEITQSTNPVEITQSTNSVEITQSTNPVEITQSTLFIQAAETTTSSNEDDTTLSHNTPSTTISVYTTSPNNRTNTALPTDTAYTAISDNTPYTTMTINTTGTTESVNTGDTTLPITENTLADRESTQTINNNKFETTVSTNVTLKMSPSLTTTAKPSSTSPIPAITVNVTMNPIPTDTTTTTTKSLKIKYKKSCCPCIVKRNRTHSDILGGLDLNKTNLSSYRRKHESSQDNRISVLCLGFCGTSVLVLSTLSIVFMDRAVLFGGLMMLSRAFVLLPGRRMSNYKLKRRSISQRKGSDH